MAEVAQLAGEEDAGSFLGGVLPGLASLVKHDAAGVYLMNRTGRRFRHTMMRGCVLPSDLDAALEGEGIVGEALGSGTPVAVTTETSGQAAVGRPCAKSRLVVPIAGNGSKVLGALDIWSDDLDGYDGDATALIGVYSLTVGGAIAGFHFLYGVERLVETVATLSTRSAAEICNGIMRDVRSHGGHVRADDRTLVVMKAVPFVPDESAARLF